jgi:hypothetical protein
MSNYTLSRRPGGAAILGAALLWSAPPQADSHLDAARQHADQAASSTDAADVAKHVEGAMNEIKAAATAKEVPATKAGEVIQAVGALQSADKHARYHNTPTAIEEAAKAKEHLDAAQP